MEKQKKISKNKTQEKNLWWRPEKYTPESMMKESEKYFAFCDDKKNWLDKWIAWKVPKPKTLTWLCLWLWVSKDYISEKAKDSRFSETIKKIRCTVENNIEEWILQWAYHATSWIFNLKNNFWRVDTQRIESEVNLQAKVVSLPPLDEWQNK